MALRHQKEPDENVTNFRNQVPMLILPVILVDSPEREDRSMDC
jgi:hypothetical protein